MQFQSVKLWRPNSMSYSLLLLLASVVFRVSSGQPPESDSSTDECQEPQWTWGRYSLFETQKKTISDAIREDKEWSIAASKIIEFAQVIGQKRIDDSWYLRCLTHDTLAMNFEFPQANAKMQLWGFGSLEKCVVDVEWDLSEKIQEQILANRVYPYLEAHDAKLTRNATAKIIQGYEGIPKENWTSLYSIAKFQLNPSFGIRTCGLFKLVTYRNGSEWKIQTAFTNADNKLEMPDFQRVYGEEFLEFSNSTIKSSRTRSLTSCDVNGNINPVLNGTLSIERWIGRPSAHAFVTERIEDNRGIQKAIDITNLPTEIVVESQLASSIAVLFLPSCLALFPVSLFQEVSLAAGFVYSIATDILAVIPVMIKGIELVYFGSNKQWAIYTRFYGGADKEKPAVAIHWIANCAMKPQVRAQGAAYLIVGLGLMVLGLVLEVFAARRLQVLKTKWFQDNAENLEATFNQNAGLLWHWRETRSRRSTRARVPRSYWDDLPYES